MIILHHISQKIVREDYLKNKLENLLKIFPEDQRSNVFQGLIEPPINSPIPHFSVADDSLLTEIVKSKISEVCNRFPMILDEQLEEEELCVLLQESSNTKELKLYLRQKTNFSEIYLEIPNETNDKESISTMDTSSLDALETLETKIAIPIWALSLAKMLGSTLLEAAASHVWDKVKKDVLGQTGLPDYYEEVYAEIRRIVSFAFDQHYLKEVQDLTAKFSVTMEHYNNMGRLEGDLLIVKNTSFDLIIKSNSLGSPGAFHYAEACVLHIMTLQESYLKLVESGTNPKDLAKARKYISKMATDFAENVVTKRNNLLTERMSRIDKEPFHNPLPGWNPEPGRIIHGIREGGYREDGIRFQGAVGPIRNEFKDHDNNFWLSMSFDWLREMLNPGHSWKWVNNELKSYSKSTNIATINEIQPLLEVAQHLRNLAEKPVGD